ncbi:DUF397 domain-containing protein [Streptomyces virginiae]|uniref:DUF397 domain-containing protein n=1 Tax=Streptomyces virginiae TaxID=1961 RepID=UPI0036950EB5
MAGQLSSNAEGGNCVGVAACPGAVHVRDSKVPVGPRLARSTEAGPFFWGTRRDLEPWAPP